MKQETNTDCTGGCMSDAVSLRAIYFTNSLLLGSIDPIKELKKQANHQSAANYGQTKIY